MLLVAFARKKLETRLMFSYFLGFSLANRAIGLSPPPLLSPLFRGFLAILSLCSPLLRAFLSILPLCPLLPLGVSDIDGGRSTC